MSRSLPDLRFNLLESPIECDRRSQSERCMGMFSADAEALKETLGDAKGKVMIESASTVGRKWLSIIPYYQPIRLSDLEVASELHKSMLADPSRLTCRLCGDEASLDHDEKL